MLVVPTILSYSLAAALRALHTNILVALAFMCNMDRQALYSTLSHTHTARLLKDAWQRLHVIVRGHMEGAIANVVCLGCLGCVSSISPCPSSAPGLLSVSYPSCASQQYLLVRCVAWTALHQSLQCSTEALG